MKYASHLVRKLRISRLGQQSLKPGNGHFGGQGPVQLHVWHTYNWRTSLLPAPDVKLLDPCPSLHSSQRNWNLVEHVWGEEVGKGPSLISQTRSRCGVSFSWLECSCSTNLTSFCLLLECEEAKQTNKETKKKEKPVLDLGTNSDSGIRQMKIQTSTWLQNSLSWRTEHAYN